MSRPGWPNAGAGVPIEAAGDHRPRDTRHRRDHGRKRRQVRGSSGRSYRALLVTAFLDLRSDPTRPTVKGRPRAPAKLRFYHLRHSRSRAPGRVSRPRHVIVFTDDGETVEVLRVLHDAMDIAGHLGDDV